MAVSKFIPYGAIAIVVAGILSILLGVFSIPLFAEEGSESTGWYILEFARAIFLVVGLAGLYLYLRRSGRLGWLGTVGFYMLLVVSVVNVIIYLIFALTKGEGAQWFDARFGPVQALLMIFGILLFGIGILRDGSLPRAGAWLWILAILVYVGIIISIIVGVSPIYSWGFLVADGLFGMGCIVLGYGLWSHWNEPVRPPRPARVS